MPHIDIKCFPRELDEQQKAALAADITDVIIRHLNSKDSSISIALQQIQPESWQATLFVLLLVLRNSGLQYSQQIPPKEYFLYFAGFCKFLSDKICPWHPERKDGSFP